MNCSKCLILHNTQCSHATFFGGFFVCMDHLSVCMFVCCACPRCESFLVVVWLSSTAEFWVSLSLPCQRDAIGRWAGQSHTCVCLFCFCGGGWTLLFCGTGNAWWKGFLSVFFGLFFFLFFGKCKPRRFVQERIFWSPWLYC